MVLKLDNEINKFKFKTINYTGYNLNEEDSMLKIIENKIHKLEAICEKKDVFLKVINEELNDKKFKLIELENELDKKNEHLTMLLQLFNTLNIEIEDIYRFNSENENEVIKFKINHACKIIKDLFNKTKIINKNNP